MVTGMAVFCVRRRFWSISGKESPVSVRGEAEVITRFYLQEAQEVIIQCSGITFIA